MSTVVDIAELEAAIAEAELSDEEAELAKEVHTEGLPVEEAIAAVLAVRAAKGANGAAAEPPAAELGEPSDKQLKALEAELVRSEKRVREIMGGHVAGFTTCEECGGVGLTPPGPKPQAHEWFKACPTCAGFGQVKTGSLREGSQAVDCPGCKGRGYLERLDPSGATLAEIASSGVSPSPAAPAAPLEPAAPRVAGADPAPEWGTPSWMGDPAIGR